MGRTPCCDKMGVKKGPWSPEEDRKLFNYILHHGFGNWRALPKQAGLLRCGKSCRLRWTNYLRPDLKRGNLSPEEEATVIALHNVLGNKWSTIASYLPGRTDNEIKNIWNTHIKKRLASASASASTSDSASASFSASASASFKAPAINNSLTHTNNECPQSQQGHVFHDSGDGSIPRWDFQEDHKSRGSQHCSGLGVKGVQGIESIEDFLLGSDAGYSQGDRIGEVSCEASMSATTHEQNKQFEGMFDVNFGNEDLRDIEQDFSPSSISSDVFATRSPVPDFSYEWLVSEEPTDMNDDVFSSLWILDE